jgi:hypothetical protein
LLDECGCSERGNVGRCDPCNTKKTYKKAIAFFSRSFPVAVQWEIAQDYQREEERPGTYSLDVWGDQNVLCTYDIQVPTELSIGRAADAAQRRIKGRRSAGRRYSEANRIIATELGKIFRSSGQSIVRHRKLHRNYRKRVVYVEEGPFHQFLAMVLEPLQRYLRERGLSPVTVDSVVRLAMKEN